MPLKKIDPRGVYGLAGFTGAAAFNFGSRILMAMYEGASFWMVLSFVNVVDVVISDVMGQ